MLCFCGSAVLRCTAIFCLLAGTGYRGPNYWWQSHELGYGEPCSTCYLHMNGIPAFWNEIQLVLLHYRCWLLYQTTAAVHGGIGFRDKWFSGSGPFDTQISVFWHWIIHITLEFMKFMLTRKIVCFTSTSTRPALPSIDIVHCTLALCTDSSMTPCQLFTAPWMLGRWAESTKSHVGVRDGFSSTLAKSRFSYHSWSLPPSFLSLQGWWGRATGGGCHRDPAGLCQGEGDEGWRGEWAHVSVGSALTLSVSFASFWGMWMIIVRLCMSNACRSQANDWWMGRQLPH